MEKHKFKQYIFALSTLSMLNSGCSFGTNRLGMMEESDNVSLSNDTTIGKASLGVGEAVEVSAPFFMYLLLTGMTNNQAEFEKYYKYVNSQCNNVEVMIPEWRSRQCLEAPSVTNDVYYPIAPQAEEVYKELELIVKKKLSDVYKWSPEKINKDWQKIPLAIMGSSQGGLVAFKFQEKYKDILNIQLVQYVDVPAMGIDIFKCTLEEIQRLKPGLNFITKFFGSELRDAFCSVVEKAIQSGFKTVSLGELLNSHNDNSQMHRNFQKNIGGDYISLVDKLKNYRGVLDIHTCAKEMWPHLRADKVGNTSETNDNREPVIEIFASDLGEDKLDLINSLGSFFNNISGIYSLVKAGHGLKKDDRFHGSDGLLSTSNQLCKRRRSFIKDKEEFKKGNPNSSHLGYRSNVKPRIFSSYGHSGLSNVLSKFGLPSLLTDSMFGSVFEDDKCFSELTIGLSKLVPARTLQDNNDQDYQYNDDLD